MKLALSGSMQFSDKMLEIQERLKAFGHEGMVSGFIEHYVGKTDEEIEVSKLDHKNNKDAIGEFYRLMKDCDALLVLNYDKHGVNNYVGGNALMEIGFAYILGQQVYLMNPIPEIPYYKTEIEAVRPIILNGDLSLIK